MLLQQSLSDAEFDRVGEDEDGGFDTEDDSERSSGDADKSRAAQWQAEEDEDSEASEVRKAPSRKLQVTILPSVHPKALNSVL